MKVLITGTLTSSLNGSARSLVRLANGLSVNHDVNTVLSDKTGVARWLNERVEIGVINLQPLRRSLKAIFMMPVGIWRFFKLLKSAQPDVVHINDIPWFYLIPVCRLMRIPVTIHSRFFEPNRLLGGIIKLFLKKADQVIFVSDYNRRLWALSSDNQTTLHNPGVFDFKIHPLKLPAERFALIVSRISEDKGIREAIRLFSGLKKIDPSLKLLIAGDTQYAYQERYKSACLEDIKSLGLTEEVHWLGHIEYPHYLYTKASVYIHLPNFEDPFPTTVMEALALNCKIISQHRGGIPEQVEGFAGCLLLDAQTSEATLHNFIVQDLSLDRAEQYRQQFDETLFYQRFSDFLKSVAKKP